MTTQTSLVAEQVRLNSGQNRCGIVRIVQADWTVKLGGLKPILQKPIIIIDSGVFEKHA